MATQPLIIRHLPDPDRFQLDLDGRVTAPVDVPPAAGYPIEGRPNDDLMSELRWYLEDFLEYRFRPRLTTPNASSGRSMAGLPRFTTRSSARWTRPISWVASSRTGRYACRSAARTLAFSRGPGRACSSWMRPAIGASNAALTGWTRPSARSTTCRATASPNVPGIYHIFHFDGHGKMNGEGQLIFEDDVDRGPHVAVVGSHDDADDANETDTNAADQRPRPMVQAREQGLDHGALAEKLL
jgi:hypothetical protein